MLKTFKQKSTIKLKNIIIYVIVLTVITPKKQNEIQ